MEFIDEVLNIHPWQGAPFIHADMDECDISTVTYVTKTGPGVAIPPISTNCHSFNQFQCTTTKYMLYTSQLHLCMGGQSTHVTVHQRQLYWAACVLEQGIFRPCNKHYPRSVQWGNLRLICGQTIDDTICLTTTESSHVITFNNRCAALVWLHTLLHGIAHTPHRFLLVCGKGIKKQSL